MLALDSDNNTAIAMIFALRKCPELIKMIDQEEEAQQQEKQQTLLAQSGMARQVPKLKIINLKKSEMGKSMQKAVLLKSALEKEEAAKKDTIQQKIDTAINSGMALQKDLIYKKNKITLKKKAQLSL